MSIEHQADFGTTKIPAPHFGRVRRPATAWKTQCVAAATNDIPLNSIDAVGTSSTGFTEAVGGSFPQVTNELAQSASVHYSIDVIQRVDQAHSKNKIRPHFGTRTPTTSPSPDKDSSLGTYLVPVADSSTMPPQNVVPRAESFGQTFAADQVVERLDFRPNWEVEQFAWPQVSTELLYQHDGLFDDLAAMIRDSILRGQKRLAITGVARGEGRTNLAITLARKLANDGQRVLIVDVDMVHPDLAHSLNLDCDLSWLTDQVEYETTAEFLVGNHESQVCIMPLQSSKRISFAKHAYELLETSLAKIEPFFDVILFDFGPVAQIDACNFRSANLASTALLVHNSEVSSVEQYKQAFEKFQSLDFWRFGFIENGGLSF